LLNIKNFPASELNQMTKQNLLGSPWSSALQYKIHIQKDAHNILGLILLDISCKPYRDNKLKKLLTAVSDITQQRQVTTVSHGSVSLSGLFYSSISISDCTVFTERMAGE